jgi:hypothetical protein
MKNLPSYESWLAESEMNEDILKTDMRKIENFLKEVTKKIRDSKVVKDITGQINMMVIDPYVSYREIMSNILHAYRDNRDVMKLATQHIKEFEGSLGPTTMPLSTMLLATQPGSPTIAF